MGFQSGRSPNFENFKTLNLRILRKMTFECSPLVNHKEYYKEEGGDFPQVRVVVSLVSLVKRCMLVYACGSAMHQKCFNYALTNLFGLCRSI